MGGVVVDIAVAAFCGYAIWRGWKRGLIRGVAKVLGLVVASVAAALLHRPVGTVVGTLGVPEQYEDLVGAVIVFSAVILGFRFVGDTCARILRATKIGTLTDAGVGAGLAALWSVSLTALVLIGISLFEGSAPARAVDDSSLGSAIADVAPDVADVVAGADLRRWILEILRPEHKTR